MKLILACTAVVLLSTAVELARTSWRRKNSIAQVFRTANVTPVPQQMLEVNFEELEIIPGIEIPPEAAIERPTIEFDFEPDSYYTFVGINPDFPSIDCELNDILSASLEALYVNVYGISDINLEDACEIAAWSGPNPFPCSGINRYFLYVYEQCGILNTTDEALLRYETIRVAFSLEEFVEAFDLSGPIAGTFYEAQYPLPPNYCID
ncbi:protein D1-like [Maniola jurtina]|uniref:protein D1-like n=1 Tax=Maniola jurtina TaxID=191418 RepID=UPI001E68A9BF|nr:protein D1-like [Maniola jurtina]